ncbi:MAG: tRNA modification GTPase [Planctomycetaceae bacterium]
MPLHPDDTIAAIASPPGAAERGIVRISGPRVADTIRRVFTPDDASLAWAETRLPRRFPGHLILPEVGIPLPAALFYWPTSKSYTGQPMAEFHTIGSPPLLDAVLDRLLESDVRAAHRGEFTMRAFLAGRIDLVQAEAVLGLIEAADHEQFQMALTQLAGGLTGKLASVRDSLVALLGDLEAGLDFVDEDIEFVTRQQVVARLESESSALQALSDDAQSRLPAGYRRRIVLAGLPNAGKSTLFNRLLGKPSAIVSPVAGTTRDFLSSAWVVGRSEVELIDTAGWELTDDPVMRQAQRQRAVQLGESDIVLWCTAADLPDDGLLQDQKARQNAASLSAQLIDVCTRCDLASAAAATVDGISHAVHLSAKTGAGINDLVAALDDALLNDGSPKSELLSSTALRCRESLSGAAAAIRSALAAANAGSGDEIIAIELRGSLHQLAVILGEVYTDDILDHIFSRFCIGK